MSTRTKFILATVALLLVFVVMEYRMPRKFQWMPTFAHQDPQPFGCMVFDSVLAASMPQGYTVERRSLWQMEQDSVFATQKGVLIITKEDIGAQVKKVLYLASRGNTVLVATTDLYKWCDTLGIDYEYNKNFRLGDIAGKLPEKKWLALKGDHWHDLQVYEQLIERTLTIPDSAPCEVLAFYMGDYIHTIDTIKAIDIIEKPEAPDTLAAQKRNTPWIVAAAFPIGKGELILVSAPLLLTNYGMVSGDSHRFIAHLMGRMQHLPVIRTESYMAATAHNQQSPLYVLLQRPPLRWAVYLTMLTLLLFCIFTARRRQRVIPVVARPRNGNLEFVRLIGTLYWQRHDNAGLLAKKLAFTIDTLRRDAGIDLSEPDGSAAAPATAPGTSSASPYHQLSALTGRNPEELRLLLHNIREAASGNYTVSDQELKIYIDQLDGLLYSL